MEHKRCYVYEPDSVPKTKRRCVDSGKGLHATWPQRRNYFDRAWLELELKIEEALTAANTTAAEDIRRSIELLASSGDRTKLPACVVSWEPGSRAKDVLTSLVFKLAPDRSERHVLLHASDAPDLKSALKAIIKQCSREAPGEADDEDDQDQALKRRPYGLGYDLQVIADEVEDIQQERYLIVISDAEAFRPDVLSELTEYLALWLDRIPFALIIGCAVRIDMLQRSLSQRALRKLNSEVAYAASCQDEIEIVVKCMLHNQTRLPHVGPQLMRSFLQRQHDYLSNVSSFIASLKYALMCATYANPLVLLLQDSGGYVPPPEIWAAVRTTASFKQLISEMIQDGRSETAADLLGDTGSNVSTIQSRLAHSMDLFSTMYTTVEALAEAQRLLTPDREVFTLTMWLQCLSGALKGSTTLRHLYLSIRKAPVAVLVKVLALFDTLVANVPNIKSQALGKRFRDLVEQSTKLNAEVIEEAGSRDRNASFAADMASLLEDWLNTFLQAPKDLAFHELWLYDSLTPSREVFTPRPRHAIERALSSPHDYLDCDCCAPEQDEHDQVVSLSATQPATAVLYQLYLESGNMINVHDAWQAFSAIMGEEMEDELKMALFQRSLADLRHLGMVKSTKRRVDHIAKTAWKGL